MQLSSSSGAFADGLKSLRSQDETGHTCMLESKENSVGLQALHEDQQRQIEELTAQLQEAQISKSRLETRCQLLEKAVSIRGEASDTAGSSVGRPHRTDDFPFVTHHYRLSRCRSMKFGCRIAQSVLHP